MTNKQGNQLFISDPRQGAHMLHRDRSRCGHQLNGSQRIEGASCIHCQGRSRPGTNYFANQQMEIIVLPEAEGGAARSRGTSSLTSVQAV